MEYMKTLLEIYCQCINFHFGQDLYYIRKPNRNWINEYLFFIFNVNPIILILLPDWTISHLKPATWTSWSFIVPIVDWLAGLIITPLYMDWPGPCCTHCRLTGWTCIVPIVDWLASMIITSLYMDWPDLYCTHHRPTGKSDNNLVVHGLAGCVLYPL